VRLETEGVEKQGLPRLDKTRLHIFTDFDGTITETDTLVFMTRHLGGGPELLQQVRRQLRSHELKLRDGIAAEMASIRVPFGEAEKLLREQVRLDSHFKPFAHWCVGQQLPLTVLSAGFYQTIDLFLPRAEFPHLTILANELEPDAQRGWQCHFRDASADGHDKAEALRQARAH
jgi:HAD superfamily phosphoserine phosphatase-like hydrolase